MLGTPSSGKSNGLIELFPVGAQELVGLGHADPPEAQPLAGPDLAHAPDIERAYRADLRVATRGLPVGQEHDRLAVADDLDAAHRHAVGDDVVAARVLDAGAAEPRAHAVALLRHLVRPVEQHRDAVTAEAIVLGTQHDANGRLRRVVGDHLFANRGRTASRRGAEGQAVALAKRAALEAAQSAPEVRRTGAESRRRVDPTGDGDVSANS